MSSQAPTREQCIDAAAEALAASNRRLEEIAKAPGHVKRSRAFAEAGQSADALAS